MSDLSSPKVKVLPLEAWMTWLGDEDGLTVPIEEDRRMPPVFGRPGWYYNRIKNVAWFEVPSLNLCYLMKPEMFLYGLRLLEVQRYNEQQIAALRLAMREGMATREQKRWVRDWDEAKRTNELVRSIRRELFRASKESTYEPWRSP
jgi:hypothetical protein